MKKTILLLAGFMLLAALAWSDEIELGFGAAPSLGGSSDNANVNPSDQSGQSNTVWVLRLGYTTLGVVNFSVDSLILPPSMVSAMTTTFVSVSGADGGGYYQAGLFRPGMINLFDAGLKLALFDKLNLGLGVGVNTLYVYNMKEISDVDRNFKTDLGANIKMEAGYKFGSTFGIEGALYSIQPSVGDAISTLKNLASSDTKISGDARDKLLQQAALSVPLMLYL